MKFEEMQESEVEDFKKLIASNVRKYRKEKKFTQLQLALSIGHNSSALLAKAELGLNNKHFNIEQIYKISRVLEIPVEKFFMEEEEL